jgi:hypothetical protein
MHGTPKVATIASMPQLRHWQPPGTLIPNAQVGDDVLTLQRLGEKVVT